MADSSTPEAQDQLVHLDRLFLIAQFVTGNVNEAANLVETAYMEASQKAKTEATNSFGSFSSLVELLLINATGGDNQKSETHQLSAVDVRSAAVGDYLAEKIRLIFLSLSDAERAALWACVETTSWENVAPNMGEDSEPDALDDFCESVSGMASPIEHRVFGHYFVRSRIARALRSFWEESFVPVPPTLRSVLESKLRAPRRNQPGEFERKASALMDRKTSSGPARWLLYTMLVVIVAGAGYLLSRPGEPESPSTNILELSLPTEDNLDVSFLTDSAEQIERLIFDRYGWRLTTPVISNATLEGLSVKTVLENVEVPVFIFTNDDDGITIPVVAFTYGFFERNRDQFELPSGTLRQIQQPAGFDIQEMDEGSAVIWRDEDDIFAAFVSEDGPGFSARVSRDS